MKQPINNPILRGFNPDPSIIRVEDDYYIATSTFEWFPGVQIHHSKNLSDWSLVARPLNRDSQLDMMGAPNSGGVWAPCLSFQDGTYYLCYSNMRRLHGNFKVGRNFLVTSHSIDGDWSDPIYLNSSGFDPSLFHGPDGRKWFLNMIWDHRPRKDNFYGIVLQEYCPTRKRLIGKSKHIFETTILGCVEGPHLYYRNGYYYLLTAEGGTGFDHAVTLARSRNIDGPYEVAPNNPILTSRHSPHAELQRTGHADIVDTPEGETYMVHLCSRPIPNRGCSPMGRETAIQKMRWNDNDWLELACGGNVAQVETGSLSLCSTPPTDQEQVEDFDSPILSETFQSLRQSFDLKTVSLLERPGYLRLKGRESLCSTFDNTFVARRQQAFRFTAAVELDFTPENFQQMAGLAYYYSNRNYYYFHVTRDESLGRVLDIACAANSETYASPFDPISISDDGSVHLKFEVDFDLLFLSYSLDGYNWTRIPTKFDASLMSDEAAGAHENFTGAFIGMACQDISGHDFPADFNSFKYLERDHQLNPDSSNNTSAISNKPADAHA